MCPDCVGLDLNKGLEMTHHFHFAVETTHHSRHFHPVSTLFPVYSCVFGMFLGGFQHSYCIRKSKAGYFQLSTLIWLVGPSLVTLSHHARSPLWHSCLPGSRSCPGLELAGGRVWCIKSQWMQ